MKSTIYFLLAVFMIAPIVARANAPQPISHGVVFFCPEKPDAAVAELRRIKADGFNLIEFASWCWTLPAPGSQLEKTAAAVLDWCDANDERFVLMHNIQFGSTGEGGGLEDAVIDPLRASHFLTDWMRVLHGHRSAAGVILGNEVGPATGNPKDHPKWWAAFTAAMHAKHGTIDALNGAWGTHFAGFDALQPPTADSPGQVDIADFAATVFDSFYGALLNTVVRPALSPTKTPLMLACKSSGDPLMQRACVSLNMICWDDMVSDYPQWRLKALGDIARRTGKPVFNSELHLYHEGYAYIPSVPKSRYRYLLSALNNEWVTASFAWAQWNKPDIQAIHSATPGILADLRRLESSFRPFNSVEPKLHVLLSPVVAGDDAEAQKLYARMAGIGLAWEYVCPQDLASLRDGTLYVPERTRLSPQTARVLVGLPRKVAVVLAAADCVADAYGRALDAPLLAYVAKRAAPVYGVAGIAVPASERLSPPYSEPADVTYISWTEKRGHYGYPMAYPKLEARQVKTANGRIIAVVNHATSGPAVSARLPWLGKRAIVTELTGKGGPVNPSRALSFAPLDVRLFAYR